MLRLIDASDWDSFYADLGDSRNMMDSYDRGYTDALDRVDDWMDVQPTIDAEKVVYCKDCARQKKGYCTIRKDSWGATLLVGNHDFCSDGERREKE